MKKGEKVRVRLETGEVVEAAYDEVALHGSSHWVIYNGNFLQACDSPIGGLHYQRCRFVGPCAVAVPSEVRV